MIQMLSNSNQTVEEYWNGRTLLASIRILMYTNLHLPTENFICNCNWFFTIPKANWVFMLVSSIMFNVVINFFL